MILVRQRHTRHHGRFQQLCSRLQLRVNLVWGPPEGEKSAQQHAVPDWGREFLPGRQRLFRMAMLELRDTIRVDGPAEIVVLAEVVLGADVMRI